MADPFEHRYRNLFGAMAVAFWECDFFPVGDLLRDLKAKGVRDLPAHFAAHPEFVREMMRATRVVDVNEQTVALFGRGDKAELLTTVEPFWSEEATGVYAASVIAAISGEPNFSAETTLRTIDGRSLDVLFTAAFPAETMNKGTLLIGVIDISAIKRAASEAARSERRYRNLYDMMPVALWQVNAEGVSALFERLRADGVEDIADWFDEDETRVAEAIDTMVVQKVNQRTLQLIGASAPEDLLGRSVLPFCRDHPGTFRRAIEARWNGRTSYECETTLSTLDGEVREVIFATACLTPEDEPAYTLAGAIDVTDRRRAEARLAEVQAEFAHAARVATLGELTASIAHEVNQPLAAIATNAAAGLRWLGRPEPDLGEVRGIVERVAADAGRAADIVGRVRAMAGHRPAAPELLSVNGVIEEATAFLQHEMQSHGVRLHLSLAPGLRSVTADRVQLQQVVVNLVMNSVQALAANPRGDRDVRVASEPDGEWIHIEVEDNGPGIPADARARLFDSFFTTKDSGLGIGLVICRNIVESHGGSLEAGDSLLGGALFSVRLPSSV